MQGKGGGEWGAGNVGGKEIEKGRNGEGEGLGL